VDDDLTVLVARSTSRAPSVTSAEEKLLAVG
jgi:hypothetical protein